MKDNRKRIAAQKAKLTELAHDQTEDDQKLYVSLKQIISELDSKFDTKFNTVQSQITGLTEQDGVQKHNIVEVEHHLEVLTADLKSQKVAIEHKLDSAQVKDSANFKSLEHG